MKTSDGQLLQNYVLKGDHKAFEQLVERYIQIAYSAAITDLKCPDLAKDATQLTFLELSKKAPTLTSAAKLGGWVFVAARNISRRIRRGESRRAERERHYIDHMKSIDEPDWGEIRPEIHAALAEIKPIYRDVIIMRFFQGKDFSALSQALDITADAARMRLNRGLEIMNAQLAKKGIRSTAAALGVALPAHAMTSVPSGLALSISNTIATGSVASIASTSILTTTLAIMKTNTTLIICALAATSITGTTFLLRSVPDSPSDLSRTAEYMTGERGHVDERKTQASSDQNLTSPDIRSKHGSLRVTGVSIDPDYLKKAEANLAMIEKMLPFMKSQMSTKFSVDLPNPTKQLQQRIGFDQNTAQAIEGIISAHNAAELKRLKDSTERSMDLLEGILTDQREEILHTIAFDEMEGAGQTLTKEQEVYQARLHENLKSKITSTVGYLEPEEPQEWYENEDTVAQIETVLNLEQGREIHSYALEQRQRKIEAAVSKRSNELANRLGLDDAERDTLHQFLTENPDASNVQISEILSPELRALLPKDEAGPRFFSFSIGPKEAGAHHHRELPAH